MKLVDNLLAGCNDDVALNELSLSYSRKGGTMHHTSFVSMSLSVEYAKFTSCKNNSINLSELLTTLGVMREQFRANFEPLRPLRQSSIGGFKGGVLVSER